MTRPDDLIAVRRRWAHHLIRRCPEPPPSYGSADWLALPEGSPAKIAAVVIAAENWAIDGDELVERLRLEVEELRAAFLRDQKAAEDAEYQTRRDEHRTSWTGRGFRPDPAIVDDLEREWRNWTEGRAS